MMKGVARFPELVSFLRATDVKTVYLIHEPYREEEVRKFAEKLRNKGFVPLVAQDFRVNGEDAVRKAISSSDFSLVVAFDDATVKKCNDATVPVFLLGEIE